MVKCDAAVVIAVLLSNVVSVLFTLIILGPYVYDSRDQAQSYSLYLQPDTVITGSFHVSPTPPSCPSPPPLSCPPSPPCPPPTSPTLDTSRSPDLCDPTIPYPVPLSPAVVHFCNGANSTTFPYRRSTRYTRNDIAVSLLTVDSHKVTRDEAVVLSWLTPQRLPYGYFGVSIPRAPEYLQPQLRIPHTSDVFISNLNKTFIALRELYRLHPDKAWYSQTSDDAYFDVDALLLKLEAYDANDVIYAGGAYRDWECWPTGHTVPYVGGGSGFSLSRGFMKRYADVIEPWMASVWTSEEGRNHTDWVLGDIMVGCFADQHGVNMTHIGGGHGAVPYGVTPDDRDFPLDHRWWAWHYVPLWEMLDADLFFALQRIDQVERHQQWKELAQLSREAAIEHTWQQKRSLRLLNSLRGVPQ